MRSAGVGIAGLAAFTALALVACKDPFQESCPCTMEIRFNYCVTVEGKVPADSLLILRVRKGATDTLPVNGCFHEHVGYATVQVWKGDSLLAQAVNVHSKAVDCCHGEDKTVRIVLP